MAPSWWCLAESHQVAFDDEDPAEAAQNVAHGVDIAPDGRDGVVVAASDQPRLHHQEAQHGRNFEIRFRAPRPPRPGLALLDHRMPPMARRATGSSSALTPPTRKGTTPGT